MPLTSNRGVSGTFAGTGQSSATDVCTNFAVDIEAGAGTVAVERLMPDGATWIVMEALTVSDDASKEYEGVGSSIRLNCTAFTTSMDYFIQGYNKSN